MMIIRTPVVRFLFSKPVVLLLTLALFLLSLTLTAFYTEYRLPSGEVHTGAVYKGWFVLLSGWVAIFTGSIGWYANLGMLITLALYCVNHPHARVAAVVSLMVALSSVLFTMDYYGNGGAIEYLSGFGAGFYCWIGAYAVLCAGVYMNAHSRGLRKGRVPAEARESARRIVSRGQTGLSGSPV